MSVSSRENFGGLKLNSAVHEVKEKTGLSRATIYRAWSTKKP